MTNNLTLAKAELEKRNATLVLYDGKEWIFSLERGIKPLLLLYEQRKDLSAFVAADKVIGKAAAFLYYEPIMVQQFCTLTQKSL